MISRRCVNISQSPKNSLPTIPENEFDNMSMLELAASGNAEDLTLAKPKEGWTACTTLRHVDAASRGVKCTQFDVLVDDQPVPRQI
jgi:hypothetical protein